MGAAFKEPDGTPRLASLAVHPTGEVEAGFKARLHGPEQQHFSAGERAAVLDLDGWKIALAICFDAAHPDHAGEAAAAGADIYAVSGLYTAGEGHRLALHLGARAMDNRMFTVLANLAGTTPAGSVLRAERFLGAGRVPDPPGRRDGHRGVDRDAAARCS